MAHGLGTGAVLILDPWPRRNVVMVVVCERSCYKINAVPAAWQKVGSRDVAEWSCLTSTKNTMMLIYDFTNMRM